jgi:hypothetical protein
VVSFYWECLKRAGKGVVGIIGDFGTLFAIALALITSIHPKWIDDPRMLALVNAIGGWIVPITLLASISIVRLILAPYWIYTETKTKLDDANKILREKPLVGIRLRNECDKRIEAGKAIYNRLHDEGDSAAISAANQWLCELKEFSELNFSVSDFDAINYSNVSGETFHSEMAKLKPSHEVEKFKHLVGNRYGRLSVIRNRIK